jgi:hypothetical protein
MADKTKKLPAAEFLQRIQEIASHFDLTDEQKSDYVNEHMKRAGFKPNVSWTDADESGSSGSSGGWFPS